MAKVSSTFLQRALTLRHMRLLIAIEELRQVGRVANALSVSQPAVSKALAELESGVGVALFERTPRGMVPTAHGVCLLRYAHTMTNEITRAAEELTAIEQGVAAPVAVGATAGAGMGHLINVALLQARQRLPHLTVTVAEDMRDHLVRQLRTGKLDVVVGSSIDSTPPPDLESMPLYIDKPVVVCGTRHPLGARKKPKWADMVGEAWVLPPRETRARAALEALFRRTGLARPQVLAETLSLDLILELLVEGAALTVLPQPLAHRLELAGEIRKLHVDTPGLMMPVSVLTLAGGSTSTAVGTFKECLVEAAAMR